MKPKTPVTHPVHGRGRVISTDGPVAIVRFEHGLEGCPVTELKPVQDLQAAVHAGQLHSPLETVVKALAIAIHSANDGWGVFSRSRIALLPHQLWVCHRVLERWPTRWLVADDVGLGKTVEAGLILTPLLEQRRVQRLLILTPASLTEQWQQRLRELFDIRMTIYTPSLDNERSDYWGTHPMVIASAHTLRLNVKGRWDRLLDGPEWDLVMVDEAHHLNSGEQEGATLTYQLVESLQERQKLNSVVFFTGTPHRGKDFNFLALLSLLRPDLFDPQQPMDEQLPKLRDVMIRNNKQRVTDLDGRKIFTEVRPSTETYSYSPEEAVFYEKLTEFISTGRAYANTLSAGDQRLAMLVLITMQKLASSSVAAVTQSLERRVARLRSASETVSVLSSDLKKLQELTDRGDASEADERSRLEEKLGEATTLLVNPDEIAAIEELLAYARNVRTETKIERILDLIDETFPNRSVLLFTEYKATQALMVRALQSRFGDGRATFINGDGALDGVGIGKGEIGRATISRNAAAANFNSGDVRFLVSTEAAGEGIDLQESCSALVHVDLPWNPMRLHQRVGRLSRYGQGEAVDVISVRNPETVESRIWECLDRKLSRITSAFANAMDDPEDMRQLVLGMASTSELERAFADSSEVPEERLDEWFNARTSTFGGEGAIRTVRDLFGSVARFDFGENAADLPRVDLPDLVPFFKAILAMHNRRASEGEGQLSFKTPAPWVEKDFAVAERYDLRFDRKATDRSARGEIAGVGHRIVNVALQDAEERAASFAVVPGLEGDIVLFLVRDRVTGAGGVVRRLAYAVRRDADELTLLRDWEVVRVLNDVASIPKRLELAEIPEVPAIGNLLERASAFIESALLEEDLPFKYPEKEVAALLLRGE